MSNKNKPHPWALHWRSNTFFITATVAIGLFTDLFLYGLVVPILPFMLRSRLGVPEDQIQSYVSGLLAAYAGSSVLFAFPAGWVADKTNSRQAPFLSGLAALLGATVMLAFGRNIPVIIVARVLQGISGAVVWTIGLAMVMDTVGPENMGKVVGSIFSFISIGQLVAPVLGGVLYEKTGYAGVFGVSSAVLALDFIMRLFIIEKKTAAKYLLPPQGESAISRGNGDRGSGGSTGDEEGNRDQEPSEEDPLLSTPGNNENEDESEDAYYKIQHRSGKLAQSVPILLCFRNPRLLVSLLLAFVQASLLALFDATIPTEAQELFGFSSLEAGLLFIATDVPYLVLGPLAGWAVDRFGTKPAAVFGFAYLVPTLVLLRLPAAHLLDDNKTGNIILYSTLLALNGVGLAVIGSPSVVEASDVVQRYDRANPGFFGPNGPYAQLYGFNSVFFNLGLTVGPLAAGALRNAIGYGNMNVVFAAACGVTALLSFLFIGGKPAVLARWKW
ncbi:hypothetical protein SLS62_008848 [Diatrype stigma]|uniref:Major facilitator superfamily (MFS) profile domain-containing protein n=1 Tax=Diatrype stigma TaxID=117547 RepID=A0AAN9YM47_9PEZI